MGAWQQWDAVGVEQADEHRRAPGKRTHGSTAARCPRRPATPPHRLLAPHRPARYDNCVEIEARKPDEGSENPGRPRAPEPQPSTRFLHPVAAACLLGLDWLVFTSGWLTGLVALPLATAVCALVALGVTAWAQRRDGNGWASSLAKAVAAGGLVALPLPIAGSVIGGWVLTLSGLSWVGEYRRRLSR